MWRAWSCENDEDTYQFVWFAIKAQAGCKNVISKTASHSKSAQICNFMPLYELALLQLAIANYILYI